MEKLFAVIELRRPVPRARGIIALAEQALSRAGVCATPRKQKIALCGFESKSSHIRNACPKSFSASRLTPAQVRVLDLSQSAASPGAAVRVLALGDAFEPELL
jgi:hypothetical protein